MIQIRYLINLEKSKRNFAMARHQTLCDTCGGNYQLEKTKTDREDCYISQESQIRLALNSFSSFLHIVKVAKVLLKYDMKPKGHIQHPAYILFSIYRRRYRRTFSSGVSWRDICLHISCIYFPGIFFISCVCSLSICRSQFGLIRRSYIL